MPSRDRRPADLRVLTGLRASREAASETAGLRAATPPAALAIALARLARGHVAAEAGPVLVALAAVRAGRPADLLVAHNGVPEG